VQKTTEPDFEAILRTLAAHRVDLIVVGGVAAVLQGVAILTLDLDIVYSCEPANLERLEQALDELHARYRHKPMISPERSHLASAGHHLLLTKHGPLDVLGTIGANRDYVALLPVAEEMDLQGIQVRVLRLPELIASKQEAGREKDHAILSVLRRTLEEREKRKK